MLELAKTKHENRELQKNLKHLENKLQLKDKEIDDFKSRLQMKSAQDHKLHDRDITLFQKFLGRAPAGSNSSDTKVMSLIRVSQEQKEQLEEENQNLNRELERLQNRLSREEDETGLLKKELMQIEEENQDLHKEVEKLQNQLAEGEDEAVLLKKEFAQTFDRLTKEFNNRISILENENNDLATDNRALRERLEKQDSYKEQNSDLKRKYDDLKNRYYAIDIGTPNKSDAKATTADQSTPQSNPMKGTTKSFTTSKKGSDPKANDRENKFNATGSQFNGSKSNRDESNKLLNEVYIL